MERRNIFYVICQLTDEEKILDIENRFCEPGGGGACL